MKNAMNSKPNLLVVMARFAQAHHQQSPLFVLNADEANGMYFALFLMNGVCCNPGTLSVFILWAGDLYLGVASQFLATRRKCFRGK